MDKDEIAAYIALYNNIIASAQQAIECLNSGSEDEETIDTYLYGAKAIVKQLATVYDIDNIQEELEEEGDDDDKED